MCIKMNPNSVTKEHKKNHSMYERLETTSKHVFICIDLFYDCCSPDMLKKRYGI